jgi:flagella basal body P-ring formation protein FlgA
VDKLEDVVGRAARRRIATGSMIPADALEDPCEVCKGQSVTVEVRSGAARLKLDAEAATAGRRGDTVTVRNPQTGKVFRARVLGKQSVGVDCTKGDTE